MDPRASSVGAEEWSGRRLLAVGVAVLVTATALLGGLGYAIYLTLAPPPTETASVMAPAAGSGPDAAAEAAQQAQQQRRDAIAAEPMLSVGPQAALPAPPSTQSAPGITIPPATGTGPGGVPTGFPRTPGGAVAQLAAIETTVFQAMSIPLTVEIHQHWTLPDLTGARSDGGGDGGGSAESGAGAADVIDLDLNLDDGADAGRGGLDSRRLGRAGLDRGDSDTPDLGVAGWEIARHVQSFLGTAQMGPEKDVTTTVTVIPAAGLVKGRDGPDWVLACVLLEVRAVITTEARIGFGHCERMQWDDGRWLIAPGTPPARAPSTWPGTQPSIDAGWRTWTDADPTLDDAVSDETARDDTPLDDIRLDDTRPDDTRPDDVLLDDGGTGEG